MILPTREKILVPLLPSVPNLGEPVGAFVDDQRHIGPCFDIVQDAGSIPEALDVGADILRPGLSDPAFQGRHQGRRFTADESPGPLVHVDAEIKSRTENIFPEKAIFLGLLDGQGHVLHRQGVFLPNVNIALVGADGIASDDQPLED